MLIKQIGTKQTFWETYDKDIQDPEEWAKSTIEYFNGTLRPGESKRKLLKVEMIDTHSSDKQHKWIKSVTGMSASFRGRVVDLMFCDRCGITGKRYGLSSTVTVDSKYRSKAYRECPGKRI